MLHTLTKTIILIQILFFYSGSISAQIKLQKGSWSKAEPGNATLLWDPSCTRPQIVVEEDFTDSAFNGYQSGVNGVNWQFFASGVAFRRPNNRSTFPLAVARNPFISAGGWAGVLWGNRINPSLGHNDPNLVEYKIDKKDDVFVTKFRGFSDFANKNERAGIEVANMETRNVLCPHPDYCHDLSFEAKQNFYSRPQDDLQLETNVENTTDRAPFGARRAHYNHLTGRPDLEFEYDNLVVWRNDPFKKKSNIEQWGAVNYGDFWLDTHMVSKLDPTNRYAIISEVQVSLFAGDTNFTLYRDGIDKNKVQIGILNVHSGITKRSDFNLDYRTNDADVSILQQYLGRTDSATIRRGDANNDTRITGEDCNAVTAFWSDSTMHPDSSVANALYEPVTNQQGVLGRFHLNLKNISYLSIHLPTGTSLTPMPNSLATESDVFHALPGQGDYFFFKKEGFTSIDHILWFNGSAGSASPEDVIFTVNYPGSCQSDGFRFFVDSTFIYTESVKSMEAMNPIQIEGKRFMVPTSVQELELSISDILGRDQSTIRFTPDEADRIQLPNRISILLLKDARTGRILGREKSIRTQEF